MLPKTLASADFCVYSACRPRLLRLQGDVPGGCRPAVYKLDTKARQPFSCQHCSVRLCLQLHPLHGADCPFS